MLFYVLEHLEMSKKCHRSYGKHLKIVLIAQDDQKPQKTLSQANKKKNTRIFLSILYMDTFLSSPIWSHPQQFSKS